MADTQLTTYNSFGQCLRYLRHRVRLTQRELGVTVGYSEAQIARLERDERAPNPSVVAAQFIPALGLEDEPETAHFLLQLAHEAHGDQVMAAPEPSRSVVLLSPPSRLPLPLTPIIGRKAEFKAISNRLLRKGSRLVTLTGPPGVGKTRLALAIAERLQSRFRDGVFFISLAPVNDADLVAHAVALGLGMIQPAGPSPQLQIERFLESRHALLVLDNFEQVSAAAPLLSQWLIACPELRILVTSREPLRLRGEQMLNVPPLELPALELLGQPISLALLSRIPAVELFIVRARDACSDFRITRVNAADICEICCHLDGLPLAIELVASRINALTPRVLLTHLAAHDGRNLDTGQAARDMPARHHSLRDAIGWSYGLLSADEKRLFRRAGVFASGFTAEAALTVSFVNEECRFSEQEAWLQSLVDKNLLRPVLIADDADVAHFGMLELIRTFALEQLETERELHSVRNQHAAYYLSFAQDFEQKVRGHGQLQWLKRAELDLNNIREALEWSLASGDVASASRIASSFRYLWHWRAHNWEGFRWITRILDAGQELPSVDQARLLNALAVTASYEHNISHTLPYCERALEQAYRSGNAFEIGQELANISIQLTISGNAAKGLYYAKLATEHAETTASCWLRADALFKHGYAQAKLCEYQKGLEQMEQARQMLLDKGDRLYAAVVTSFIGSVHLDHDDYDGAQPYFDQVITVFRQDAEMNYIFNALLNQAGCIVRHGRWQPAARLGGAVEHISRQSGILTQLLSPQEAYDFTQQNSPSPPDWQTFIAAWTEGKAMSLDQAIACAIEKS